MSWNRQQFKKERKHLRHARVPLGGTSCTDCGRGLHTTHSVLHFGGRCRSCFSSYSSMGDGVAGGRAVRVVW